jgi:hypothetical protein
MFLDAIVCKIKDIIIRCIRARFLRSLFLNRNKIELRTLQVFDPCFSWQLACAAIRIAGRKKENRVNVVLWRRFHKLVPRVY